MECARGLEKAVFHRHCDFTHTPCFREDPMWRVQSDTEDAPKENLSSCPRRARDRRPSHPQWCETPKLSRKDVCLRRRLLGALSLTDVKLSATPGATYTPGRSVSPEVLAGAPLSYSTIWSHTPTTTCMKRRLLFCQAVTSTLEDGRGGAGSPSLSEPDLDETIISGLILSDTPEVTRGRDCFRTPSSRPATDPSESPSVLGTPSRTPLSGLDASEDSGFGSLRLDVSEHGGNDGSFQEGVPRLGPRRSRLERQRRLSTLREGSQSDDEVRGQHVKGRSLKLDEDVFLKTPPVTVTPQDLSITPALQAIETLSRSFTLSHELDQPIRSGSKLSRNLDQSIAAFLPLSHLIGRKMGLGKMDVLTELHVRNLHHVLSSILQLLSAREIDICSRVCDSWSVIILQDRKANRRRKTYEREQKRALETGIAARVVDAETRLELACRSALSRVQAQAKTPSAHTHTPAVSGTRTHTPATAGTEPHTPPSTKRQQFLQIAKTLFSDECLRPCPRCERPARCHSVKAEGVCSWSECVFHFCTSCLRAYHGSADCTRLPNTRTHRNGRSQLLPGSARSKRNVKRL